MNTAHSVAPDGGWGFIVCIGMAMPFISGLAALPSFGLVFNDFIKDIGAHTSDIAFITSAFFCAFSFAGLLSAPFTRSYSLRSVGILGGVIYFVGSLLQIFVWSIPSLLFSWVIQGIGFGIIVPISYATFNNYFVKKRVMFMSFAQIFIGIGTMFYPIVMNALLECFGFRGCLAILASLNAHAILGMLLMQPVKWHMKTIKINDQQLESLTKVDRNPISEEETNKMDNLDKKSSSIDLKKSLNGGSFSGSSIINNENRRESTLHSNAVSYISIPTKKSTTLKSCFCAVVEFLDLSLLKDAIYLNIVFGISFALYSDIAFFTFQPLYLFELGYEQVEISNIIAIGAASDLISRIVLATMSSFLKIRARYIYFSGALLTVIGRIVFLNITDFLNMAIITTLLGFLRTWIHVPLPLVFAEYLPKDRFATGYGLFMFLQGNIMFIVSSFIDKTNFYVAFQWLNLFMALCVIFWFIEILYKKIYKIFF